MEKLLTLKNIAFVVGIVAVIFYLLGYLQKKRNRIILFNVTSRVLYIIQYIILGAFWLDNEKTIRRVSFLGCPFWLLYNFISGAYGSCIGDILSMVSIVIAMYRYDFKNNRT